MFGVGTGNSGNSRENEAVKEKQRNDVAHSGPTARARSLSVATAQPSVETVVVKAKRAASSLWLLLHSQVSFTVALWTCYYFVHSRNLTIILRT